MFSLVEEDERHGIDCHVDGCFLGMGDILEVGELRQLLSYLHNEGIQLEER